MFKKYTISDTQPSKKYSLVDDTRTFRNLASSLEQLNTHFQGIQRLHDNFTQFNESVGSLMYGLNINSWCTEFVEAPTAETFENKRKVDQLNGKIHQLRQKISLLESGSVGGQQQSEGRPKGEEYGGENSHFSLLSDDSFVINPEEPQLSSSLESTSTLSTKKEPSPAAVTRNEPRAMPPSGSVKSSPSSKYTSASRRQSRIPQLGGYKSNRATMLRQQYHKAKQEKSKER